MSLVCSYSWRLQTADGTAFPLWRADGGNVRQRDAVALDTPKTLWFWRACREPPKPFESLPTSIEPLGGVLEGQFLPFAHLDYSSNCPNANPHLAGDFLNRPAGFS